MLAVLGVGGGSGAAGRSRCAGPGGRRPRMRDAETVIPNARHESTDIGEGFIWGAVGRGARGTLIVCALLVLWLYPQSIARSHARATASGLSAAAPASESARGPAEVSRARNADPQQHRLGGQIPRRGPYPDQRGDAQRRPGRDRRLARSIEGAAMKRLLWLGLWSTAGCRTGLGTRRLRAGPGALCLSGASGRAPACAIEVSRFERSRAAPGPSFRADRR